MEGFEGIEQNKMWWSEKTIDMFEGGPFRLLEYMSGRRFQNIGTAICYTNIESPAFLDRFHNMRQMIEGFNDHYDGEYIPSWLNCLDKSINIFLDKFFQASCGCLVNLTLLETISTALPMGQRKRG